MVNTGKAEQSMTKKWVEEITIYGMTAILLVVSIYLINPTNN